MNFPQMHYAMSSDPAPFVAPERYPSPPKDMWYEVPKERPAPFHAKPKAVFPWESHQPRPTRVFPQPERYEEPEIAPAPASHHEHTSADSRARAGTATSSSSTGEEASEPSTPRAPASRDSLSATSDIWSSFPRTNAWDDVPEINRYVDAIEKHRRTRSRGSAVNPGGGPFAELGIGWERRGSKVTQFPSADDRPSLPVTPAPIRRSRHWGSGGPGSGGYGEGDEQLPGAEGVPTQSDWVCVHGIWWGPADCLCDLTNILRCHKDPVAQLQKLAQQQSQVLRKRLGGVLGEETIGKEGREIPSRPLPYGSEGAKSPTYVAHSPTVISPTPVKPDTGTSTVNKILAATPQSISRQETGPAATTQTRDFAGSLSAPSYQGPGASFEKGEDYPTFETPALPTEEDRDVLDT